MQRKFLACTSALPLLAGCVANDAVPSEPSPPLAEQAMAVLTLDGMRVGEANFTQLDNGVRVVIRVDGLPPGVHAAHIHETGVCTPPDYSSAGGHWNPSGRQHGRDNPEGQHMGDMPNMIVGQSGTGTLEVTISYAQIEGGAMALLDADGAAVMVHAGPDDYRSDPAGNAGPRIACGVIEPVD